MNKSSFLTFCFGLFFFTTISAQITEQWSRRYTGAGDYSDKINCMVMDGSGNIYQGGYTVNTNQNRDILVVKLNSSGDTMWKRMHSGPGFGADEAVAIVLDNANNVIVTGFQKGNSMGDDYITIKYNNAGDTLWTRTYNYINEDDIANSIAVDYQNNIYVTGQSDSDPSMYGNDDYLTIKYDAAGNQKWIKRFNGFGNGTDRAVKVLVDNQKNVYITGRSANDFDDDFITMKYDSTGLLLWFKIFDAGFGNDRAVSMVLDNLNNVYVTGRSNNGTDDDIVVVKYNSAGIEQWVPYKRYDGTGADADYPNAMAIDASANIYVTGMSDVDVSIGINYNFVTLKYNSAGTQQWVSTYNGVGNGDDIPNAITVDNSGNVYVTGESDANPSLTLINKDYATVKYNSAGTQQWVKTYDGTMSSEDRASSILVDNSGNVFVSGGSYNLVTQKDAATIKYNSAGTQQWLKTISGQGDQYDNVNAITTDASGNVYVAGYTITKDMDRDMCTIKIGPTGDTLWTRKFNGTASYHDEANAINVDASGFVYVAGFTKNIGRSYDYTTIKYNSSGDTVWTRKYDSPVSESDKAWAMDVDASGNVYVTGESDGDGTYISNDDFCIIKYNSSGALQWVKRYNGTGNSVDRAIAVKVSSAGNIFVCGRSASLIDDDFVTIKYNNAGTQLWVKTYNGTFGADLPTALFVDANENSYITGNSKQSGGINDDYATVKYNSAGTQKWVARFNGTINGDDNPKAIVVDINGNVYVTGESGEDTSQIAKNLNYLTVKYDSLGTEKWTREYTGLAGKDDVANAIAVDDSSNIYISGRCDNGNLSAENYDYITIKYDPSGTLKWYAVYNGTANTYDGANSIAVRNNGVFVGGGSEGIGTQRDILVLKYLTSAVGIEDISSTEQSIIVYPNPFSESATIEMQGLQLTKLPIVVELFDVTGKKANINYLVCADKIILNRSNLKSGIYFVNLMINSQNRVCEKIIIQ